MPHWLALTLSIAGSFTLLVGAAAALRKVVRGVRDAWRQLLALLGRIETASKGITALRGSLAELAGSMVRLVAAMQWRQDEQAQQLTDISERLDALTEMTTDLDAALRRNLKERRNEAH